MTHIAETTADADAHRLTPRVALLSAALAIGFAALIGVSLYFVVKDYRPTLNWDQWGDLKFLFDIKNGTFLFHELFAQNNEHRVFTARLFFLIDAFWFDYSNIFLLTVIFVSHLLLGGLIAFLWFDRNQVVRLRATACIGGAATLVTIIQYDNLLWGFQTVFSHVYLFALLALLAVGTACLQVRNRQRWLYLGLYVVFYALSAFTMANGLLVVGAAVVLTVFLRGRWLDIIVIVAAALIISALYMHGYHAPGHHNLADQLSLAPRVLLYTCYFLGAPLATFTSMRVLLGAGGIALLGLATAMAMREILAKRRMPLAPAVLVCMAGFVFISTVVTGIGRVSFGLEQAASGRYATVALIFWLSIAGVAYWLVVDRFKMARSARSRNVFVVTLLTGMFAQDIRFNANTDTQRVMSEWALRIDRASMAIINNVYFTEGQGLDVLYIPRAIKERAGLLRAYGWNVFSPRQKTYAPPIHVVAGLPAAGVPTCRGFVDSVIRLDGQRLALRGWLLASAVPQSPSWIFVRDQLDGVVGYFLPLDWRQDLVNTYGPFAGNGYFAAVDFKHPIPAGTLKVSFVAVFDRGPERVCTFVSELKVPAYEIASNYGEVAGRPITELQAVVRGRAIAQQGWPPGYFALPVPSDKLFTVGPASSEPAVVTFRFDAAKLGSDDLAIPVAANTGYIFPIEVSGPSGPVENLTLNTLNYDVWRLWRLAIIPRGRLPAEGEIVVTIQIPANIPAAGATIGPPFATPANPNRAALY
jgi:hypothetical protein